MSFDTDVGRAIAWRWNAPYTRRGDYFEIEGIGSIDRASIEAVYEEWLTQQKPREDAIRQMVFTDRQMPRPVEDLIDILIGLGVINYSGLPIRVQQLIDLRKQLRTRIT